jgi:hypothetical protein
LWESSGCTGRGGQQRTSLTTATRNAVGIAYAVTLTARPDRLQMLLRSLDRSPLR